MNILENELKKEKTQRTGKSYKLKNKIRKPMEDPHPPPQSRVESPSLGHILASEQGVPPSNLQWKRQQTMGLFYSREF